MSVVKRVQERRSQQKGKVANLPGKHTPARKAAAKRLSSWRKEAQSERRQYYSKFR